MVRGLAAATTSACGGNATTAARFVRGAPDFKDLVLERDDHGMFSRERRGADDGPSRRREVVTLDRFVQ